MLCYISFLIDMNNHYHIFFFPASLTSIVCSALKLLCVKKKKLWFNWRGAHNSQSKKKRRRKKSFLCHYSREPLPKLIRITQAELNCSRFELKRSIIKFPIRARKVERKRKKRLIYLRNNYYQSIFPLKRQKARDMFPFLW